MSTINTNGIDVNYPVPGVNNNTQGFRDNFNAIKSSLNTAASEITELQNTSVLKQSLANSVLNNDMANTLISNASTLGFRATTYNLGNNLSGEITIDLSLGDVHYGSITEDTYLTFKNWAPVGTQSNVELQLNISNANARLYFPTEVVFANNNFGVTTLENYANVNDSATITAPNGVSRVDYRFSTLDCGTTITVEPYNRPRITTQIQQRVPLCVGAPGDIIGTVAVDTNYLYTCIGNYDGNIVTKTATATYSSGNLINVGTTTNLSLNVPIIFTGDSFGGLIPNSIYYIKTISGANITISQDGYTGNAGDPFAVTDDTGTMIATCYNGTKIWSRVGLSAYAGTSVTGDFEVTGNTQLDLNLSVVGNIRSGNITSTGNITATSNISANNISITNWANVARISASGNITAGGNVVAGNLTGTLLTNAQTNITSVGTLGNLSVSGNIGVGNNLSVANNISGRTLTANIVTLSGAYSGNSNVSTVTGNLGLRIVASEYTDNVAAASSTITKAAIHSIGRPTVKASNSSVTLSNVATFYIENAPLASTNITISNNFAFFVNAGNSYFNDSVRIGGNANITTANITTGNITHINGTSATITSTTITTANVVSINVSGAATGNANVSTVTTGTTGLGFRVITSVYTNNTAAGVIANAAIHAIATPTLISTNAITTTNLATFYIQGAPTTGANVTATNKYALFVGSGNTLLSGALAVSGPINASGTTGSITGANISTSGYLLSNSASTGGGVGYGPGAYGAFTQGTSRTTAVNANAYAGAITLFSAASTTSPTLFTVNNDRVAATDVIVVNQRTGTDQYMINVTKVSAGSFQLRYVANTGGVTEAPVFNFTVLKANLTL